jgi:methenyltetrahydromethanopterin cyclohydrolase
MNAHISINKNVEPAIKALKENAKDLEVHVSKRHGVVIIDAGVKSIGSLEAGRRIAEICMGSLGKVMTIKSQLIQNWPLMVEVSTKHPALACLASQYAGWSLKSEDEGSKFECLGSGPCRALALKEDLFKDLDYKDQHTATCVIMEVDKFPPEQIIEKICKDCNIERSNLSIILTPTTSIAGTTQIVSRVVEVGLHKAHELGYNIHNITAGNGTAPIPPLSNDQITAMGRTNDAILFGGEIVLTVQDSDESAKKLANEMPSNTSADYGQPFSKVFKNYNYDFYKIDPMLFSPAYVTINNEQTGNIFQAGEINSDLLDESFED